MMFVDFISREEGLGPIQFNKNIFKPAPVHERLLTVGQKLDSGRAAASPKLVVATLLEPLAPPNSQNLALQHGIQAM